MISPLASRVGLPISRVISAARSSIRSLYSSATRSRTLDRSSFPVVRQVLKAWAERSSICSTSASVAVGNSRSVSLVAGLTTLYSLTQHPSSFAACPVTHDKPRTSGGRGRPPAAGPGSASALLARVGGEPVEFVRVDDPHRPRREHLLEEAADPAGAVPARGDPHQRRSALRGDGGRGDQAGAGVGLGEDAARLGLVHVHPVLAGAPARGHLEPRDGAGAGTAGLNLEIRERRGQV